jgi:SAM-dependent methyltransferase
MMTMQTENASIWPVDLSHDPLLRQSFDLLRQKWGEVPFRQYDRIRSDDLLSLKDEQILETWSDAYLQTSTGKAFSVRGWYQVLYKDSFRGKKILDVGCGLAPDTVFFAEHGAKVTFLDIVEPNVKLVQKICELKGLREASFYYLHDLNSLAALPNDYDVIYCCGSFINAPLEVSRMEAQALLSHLPVGGRWIELGYPKIRWEREGRLPFHLWGQKTDGGAPWIEWHDLGKLDYMFAPATFDVILSQDFHNSDFNWFDLVRRA